VPAPSGAGAIGGARCTTSTGDSDSGTGDEIDGIWYGPDGAYPEEVTVANTPKGVSVEMLRRHLIALGGVVMVGAPIKGVGELLGDLGGLPPAPLPSRLSYIHMEQARDLA
jgi:hypothetical protein